MNFTTEIILIALLTATACSLLGTFLVLRKQTMVSDAISHTVLLGIVLGYFLTKDMNSPLLILGASLMGVLTVIATETLSKSKFIDEHAAIGLIFPFFFSIALILITKFSSSLHLDVDKVLLGELAFAPFQRLQFMNKDWGALGLYHGLFLLILNSIFIIVAYKPLKLATFDPISAQVQGLPTTKLHYLFMILVSLTTVIAFDVVGAVLVLAFMTIPPNTALLFTNSLKTVLFLSCFFAILSSYLGIQVAFHYDLSLAGTMAVTSGLLFLLSFILSPSQGLIRNYLNKKQVERQFLQFNLLSHIRNHQNTPDFQEENGIYTINEHLVWSKGQCKKNIKLLLKEEKLVLKEKALFLTKKGESQWEANFSQFI